MTLKPVQTILVPLVDQYSLSAVNYAQMLSEAYQKPLSLLCLNPALESYARALNVHYTLSSDRLSAALAQAVANEDCVMIVWPRPGSRRLIQRQLNACRDLRIPYFFIPHNWSPRPPQRVLMPISFLIEDREKAAWGRSLHRQFTSHFTLLKPRDKGTRAAKNVDYIAAFFQKNAIPYTLIQGRKSSFKNDKEALKDYAHSSDLMVVTASREYGLDDQFFGPKELGLIHKSPLPLMMLNPRADLYILCGD